MDTITALVADGEFSLPAAALMNGKCEVDFTWQQFLPCEQGIVLQHCIICIGVTAGGQSTAYTERADTRAANRIVVDKRILSRS